MAWQETDLPTSHDDRRNIRRPYHRKRTAFALLSLKVDGPKHDLSNAVVAFEHAAPLHCHVFHLHLEFEGFEGLSFREFEVRNLGYGATESMF